ncbi:ParA family protein [Diaphorobacter sp. LR2014-1]|uniref:ParA family protein n=2 Tax=Pseudomonadota TaxID=1224 RepID=UPI000CDAE736|nr:ParA family protein [Diaphorobacter sp. LR2014-1]
MVSFNDLKQLSTRSKAVVATARRTMLAPDTSKIQPFFSITDVELHSGIPASRIRTVLRHQKVDGQPLPSGRTKEAIGPQADSLVGRGSKLFYTADEYSTIMRALNPERYRPKGVNAVVISVCNYKGGVTKSTSAVSLAQALSSLGHGRILAIDLDPQGSLTNLFGYSQTLDIESNMTTLPILMGHETSLKSKVLKTYWPGADLIPSDPALQSVESNFMRDIQENGLQAMLRLRKSLVELKTEYDFIIIDTPPSLNNLTTHALLNTDGVIMPLPPSNLDLCSASMFWDLFIETCARFGAEDHPDDAIFSFIKVFSPKVERTRSCQQVLHWIKETYARYLSGVQVPKSAAVASAADSFSTVFDTPPKGATYKRSISHDLVRDAYIDLAKEVEVEAMSIWYPSNQVKAA